MKAFLTGFSVLIGGIWAVLGFCAGIEWLALWLSGEPWWPGLWAFLIWGPWIFAVPVGFYLLCVGAGNAVLDWVKGQ